MQGAGNDLGQAVGILHSQTPLAMSEKVFT